MKTLAKKLVVLILNWQVKRLHARHQFKTVIIGGSIGKTSTKFAIAAVLKQKFRVRYQEGNYNDLVTVPLIFFGQTEPNIFNPLAWLGVFIKNERQIRSDYSADLVILELGTDGPGQIAKFKSLPIADLAVITAIAPEHMEYFKDLDEVAKEELALAKLARQTLLNKDLCDSKYLSLLKGQTKTYSIKEATDYQLVNLQYGQAGYEFDAKAANKLLFHTSHNAIAESQLYSLCAAIATGDIFGLNADQIQTGLGNISAVNGRMQRLKGINDAIIIDDTYNSSPEAVKGALDTLYRLDAPQKIAILGSMNELGKYSETLHAEVGNYCDPKQLNVLVTIGAEANRYLAPVAQQKGCNVQSFDSPYKAGEYVKPLVKQGAVILVKGSQNNVFAEESLKSLLADPADSSKLVRQSGYWMGIKKKQFGGNK